MPAGASARFLDPATLGRISNLDLVAKTVVEGFISGLHRWENRWLHVSKGVGCLFGVRFNCRPEISLLTLS